MGPAASERTGVVSPASRETLRVEKAASVSSRWSLALVGAAAVAAGTRLLFSGLPLTPDEAGYGIVVRLWRGGAELYDEAWVDRPQGLLLVFRLVLSISDSVAALRGAAILVGLVVLVLAMYLARNLLGERTAIYAGFLVATAGASPFIESFTLCGELVASLFSVASLLVFVRYLEGRGLATLVACGLLAGSAVMIKQSAFDAVVVAVVFLVWKERARGGVRAAAVLLGAACVPALVAALAAPDLGNWWHAVVTYRMQSQSIWTAPFEQLPLLVSGVRAAGVALAVPLILALGGWRLAPPLLKLWLLAALVGIAGGGNFWPHYWVQIVPPLCLIAALRLRELVDSGQLRRPLRVLPVAAAAVFSLSLTLGPLFGNEATRVARLMPGESLRVYDAEIAAYVASHTSANEEVLIVPPIGAPIQFLADRPPAYRYLWYRPAHSIPGAVEELRALVAARPPRYVVVLADPAVLDPAGETTRLLRRDYRIVREIGPTAVLVRREGM